MDASFSNFHLPAVWWKQQPQEIPLYTPYDFSNHW